MFALHAITYMMMKIGLPVMDATRGITLDVPAWKPCQEPKISGYAKNAAFDP